MSQMENWNTNKLKDLGSITANGVNKKIDLSEIPVSLVNYMDVYSYNKIDNNFEFQQVTANQRQIENCNLLKGDVLFTPTSETPDDIGNSAVIIEHLINAVYSYHIVRFRQNDDIEFDTDFLAYLFNQYDVLKYFTSRATGITRFTLNRSDFQNLTITYPDPAEQRAIASVLSKVDDAIAATKKTIAKAQRLKKALMQNLLTGKLKPDGTRRSEDEFYIDEKFGKVPMGWEVRPVADVFEINNNTLTSNTDPNFQFNYITIESVSTENINLDLVVKLPFKDSPSRARRVLSDGDIVISTVRPNLKAFIVFEKTNDEDWVCSTGFNVLTAKENQNNKFYFYQILSEIGEKQFFSFISGTNYPAVTERDFNRITFYKPPIEAQIEISEKIEKFSNFIQAKEQKIQKLERLKKALMQNLLTGKKRLKAEYIQGFSNG